MELQMQYTYKNVSVSMLKLKGSGNGVYFKNMIILFHNSKIHWKKIKISWDNVTYLTNFQAIKQFMKMVKQLNKGIINIRTK